MKKGPKNPVKAEKHHNAILMDRDVLEMVAMRKRGDRVIDIADHFDFSPKHVGKILNGEIWVSVAGIERKKTG